MNKNLKFYRGLKYGFTLIEVLIVVIIVGLLSGVAVVKLANHIEVSRTNYLKFTINQLESNIQTYILKYNTFPTISGETPVEQLSQLLHALDDANLFVYDESIVTVLANLGSGRNVTAVNVLDANNKLIGSNVSGNPETKEILVVSERFGRTSSIVYPDVISLQLNDPNSPSLEYYYDLYWLPRDVMDAWDYFKNNGEFLDEKTKNLVYSNLQHTDMSKDGFEALIREADVGYLTSFVNQLVDMYDGNNDLLADTDIVDLINIGLNNKEDAILALSNIDYTNFPWGEVDVLTLGEIAKYGKEGLNDNDKFNLMEQFNRAHSLNKGLAYDILNNIGSLDSALMDNFLSNGGLNSMSINDLKSLAPGFLAGLDSEVSGKVVADYLLKKSFNNTDMIFLSDYLDGFNSVDSETLDGIINKLSNTNINNTNYRRIIDNMEGASISDDSLNKLITQLNSKGMNGLDAILLFPDTNSITTTQLVDAIEYAKINSKSIESLGERLDMSKLPTSYVNSLLLEGDDFSESLLSYMLNNKSSTEGVRESIYEAAKSSTQLANKLLLNSELTEDFIDFALSDIENFGLITKNNLLTNSQKDSILNKYLNNNADIRLDDNFFNDEYIENIIEGYSNVSKGDLTDAQKNLLNQSISATKLSDNYNDQKKLLDIVLNSDNQFREDALVYLGNGSTEEIKQEIVSHAINSNDYNLIDNIVSTDGFTKEQLVVLSNFALENSDIDKTIRSDELDNLLRYGNLTTELTSLYKKDNIEARGHLLENESIDLEYLLSLYSNHRSAVESSSDLAPYMYLSNSELQKLNNNLSISTEVAIREGLVDHVNHPKPSLDGVKDNLTNLPPANSFSNRIDVETKLGNTFSDIRTLAKENSEENKNIINSHVKFYLDEHFNRTPSYGVPYEMTSSIVTNNLVRTFLSGDIPLDAENAYKIGLVLKNSKSFGSTFTLDYKTNDARQSRFLELYGHLLNYEQKQAILK